MTNSTQEREAAARARCDAATKGPWKVFPDKAWDHFHILSETEASAVDERGDLCYEVLSTPHLDMDRAGSDWDGQANADFAAHARTDLPRSLDENQRLRDQLIGAWTHTALKCPCSPRQLEGDTDTPAPPDECTCGLKEALYGT